MAMRFESDIRNASAEAMQKLYGANVSPSDIVLQETRKEFDGDITLVIFQLAKLAGKSPEITANEVGNYLKTNVDNIESFNVVKGFLNIVIDGEFWKKFLSTAVSVPDDIFKPSDSIRPQYLMVEYSSPNTNKPLHLGHIRNNLLGYAVSRILEAAGHKVVTVNLVNDRGIHICKSMLAWKKFGNGETPVSSGMKGDHLVGKYYVLFDRKLKEEISKLVDSGMDRDTAERRAPIQAEVQEMLVNWEAGDPETMELWKTMNGWVYEGFEETYKKLGVAFDRIYYESQTYLSGKKIVDEGLSKGVFFRKEDGSVWIDMKDAGLDQKVLLRSDGTSVYITQDLGTAQLRFDDFPGLERLIYVVGNEQDYHFKVLKEIFRRLGRSWADGLFHLSYGMVDLPTGKMKSREGTVVDADDLIHEITEEAEMTTKALGKLDEFDSPEAKQLYHTIGMGALKYFILKVDPRKKMLFNPAESIDFNGNTGPFIQYTYARIRSVLRKGSTQKSEYDWPFSISNEERTIIRLIYNYTGMLEEAAKSLSPSIVAQYAYDVAKAFNHFYHDHVIVDEDKPAVTSFRLRLSSMAAEVISRSMGLLGINVPERM